MFVIVIPGDHVFYSFCRQIHRKKATVKVAAEVFRSLCYDYRDDFSAGILVAGWDEVEGGQVR